MAVIVINEESNNIVDSNYLKLTSNVILSYAYDALSKYPEPNRDEYDNDEDYKRAFNEYLMRLVEYVSKIKFNVFSDVLDFYNESISIENRIRDSVEKFAEQASKDITYYNGSIRRGFISAFICSLLFPNMMPVFVGLCGARYFINNSIIKRKMTVTAAQMEALRQFREDKENIFVFQDSLRTDYHKRKGELEELKRMILSGKVNKDNKESFLEKLKQLINPETYSLEKLDEDFYENRIFLLNLMGKDVLLDTPAQLIKK